MREEFGDRLHTLRTRLNLTTKQLAVKATVPESLICGLQAGSRTIGENNARKIGTALGLTGAPLEEFVYLAINNAKEKVLDEYKGYPAEVLNLVAHELQQSGIAPEMVNRCVRHPKLQDGLNPHAAVFLKDGRSALIEINISQR
ncbi:MAG: helix-turn-helix transcriptional regulator [Chthoniobacter sp.]|uniref:helix-turn-helix domain-containing protein n=1 Tax=Chthoniobacter sp. TaxID=2510640 RepID=UPI0032A7549C